MAAMGEKVPSEGDLKFRLSVAESQAIKVIKEDLAEWLGQLLEIEITSESFLDELDTGVHLCVLARSIQTKGREYLRANEGVELPVPLPMSNVMVNFSAGKESFQARDNASNFITFCKAFGLEDPVMFESDGLVMHKDEKGVVLCLMELARRVGRMPFNMPLPNLIKMELEIDKESLASCGDLQQVKESENEDSAKEEFKDVSPSNQEESVPSNEREGGEYGLKLEGVDHQEDYKGERKERESSSSSCDSASSGSPPRKRLRILSGVDGDVVRLVSECGCQDKLQVRRLKSGKFEIIKGKRTFVIFVRILSDTIMVRVGGGWDSLNHFLLKHDPCRVKLLNKSCDIKEVVSKEIKKQQLTSQLYAK